ncbi:MAG TPA: hypothetical protein VGS02_03140 [Acidobacteriaceae bacterium]|nr:hypothetical protein [Acidobacteriaceae bacterium]
MSQMLVAQQVPVPKVISPTAHGVIDYCHVAFFFTVGLFCARKNPRAATAAFATSGFVLGQSLLTDYRLGLRPVLPFRLHGKMDQVFAATSWLMPFLFGFRGTAAARIFEVNSLAEGGVVAMTDWSSARARLERVEAAWKSENMAA